MAKSPTFHNFADLHNIVIKDIFAWVYLVSTEQITNRVSLEIIGIGCNCSEMDRDRYSGNCMFNFEVDNGQATRRKRNRKIFCVDTLRDDKPPAFLSFACMLGEALKTNEKESCESKN